MDAQGWSKFRLLDQSVILTSKFFVDFTNVLTFRCESHGAFFDCSLAVITGIVIRHRLYPHK